MGENRTTIVEKTVQSGITFGSALAMVISYTTWKSVGWAIFHGLLSWVYVIYFRSKISRNYWLFEPKCRNNAEITYTQRLQIASYFP